ncbi:MAG: hypothetical protein PVJ43_00440 [Gemmatimonadales bacterium]
MRHARQLLSEVHRRFLWQAFAIYIVVAFIAYHVSGHIATSRNLPGWFVDVSLVLLIIGLPIVLITAAVQEGIPSPGRSDPSLGIDLDSASDRFRPMAAPPRAGLARLFTWRNAIMGGVAAFTLWAIVAAAWLILAEQLVRDLRRPDGAGAAVEGQQ